jgi:hypothetical protein
VTTIDRADIARAIARAVVEVPGVTRLVSDAGPVEVATLHRAGKIVGVRCAGRIVSVHVAVDVLPLQEVSTAIHQAVRHVLGEAGDDRDVNVVIERLDGIDGLPGSGGVGGVSGSAREAGR